MKLLSLTITKKNGVSLTTPTQALVDINDVLSPIRSNGKWSYFAARSDKGQKLQDDFEVSETLSVIAAQSINLFYATVTSRRGQVIGNEVMVFNVDNVFKTLDVNGTGSKFLYRENDQFQYIEYKIAQNPTAIYTQTTSSSGSAVWGGITGNVLNQTDVINYINTPRVVSQASTANIIIDPTITDAYVADVDQDCTLVYMADGVSEQILVLQLFESDGLNHAFSLDILYHIYDGVFIPATLDHLKITTLTLIFNSANQVWSVFNCSTVDVS